MKGAKNMKRTTIKQLYRTPELQQGEKVRVAGWIRSIRANNKIGFVSINDGSFFECLQVVIEKDKLENYDEIAALNVGSRLSLMRTALRLRVRQLRIIRFRKNAIRMNISERLRICAREQILFQLFSV